MQPPPPVIFAVGEETGCKAFLSPLFLPTPSGIWSLFRFRLFLPAVGTGRACAVLRYMAACTCFDALPADSPLAAEGSSVLQPSHPREEDIGVVRQFFCSVRLYM